MLNFHKGLLRKSHTRIDNFVPVIRLSTLYLALDDGLDNIGLNTVCRDGVMASTILEEQLIRLLTLMDEKNHVTPIINNQVRYVTLTITLLLYQGIQNSVPVLLETLTIPGKHSIRFAMFNDSHSEILGREKNLEHQRRSLLRALRLSINTAVRMAIRRDPATRAQPGI